MASALLGEDGRGYELARRLEACGAWRAWLGEPAYAAFSPALASPSTWDSFLAPRVGRAGIQLQLQLQLRARALLYDKASACLFLSQANSINDINPNFLQLHGDDVYFSLDEEKEDGSQLQSQSAFTSDPSSPKWPSTWYKQFAEKFRIRHHRLPSGEKEITKRSPDGMLSYLKLSAVHKRKRQVFKDYQSPGDPISLTDETLFPEMFFPADCVPDSALPKADCTPKRAKPEFHTVLDTLPTLPLPLPTRSPAMIERFGILPDYYKPGGKQRDSSKSPLSAEQEALLARKAVVRALAGAGFESGSGGAVGVMGEVVGRRAREMGRTLRALGDGYRKDCSAVELVKMFLQVSGYSVAALSEITKCGNNNNNNSNNNNHNRALAHQMQQQHAHSIQSQHPNNLFNSQQLQRQFHPQAQIPNLPFQQQQLQQQQHLQLQMRRNNNNNNNSQMKTHNPLVDVKIESSTQMDLAQHQMDGFGGNNNNIISNNSNVSNVNNGRNQQLQLQQQLRLQQQQQMMMGNNSNNNIVQSGNQQQFKPMQSVQISQLQAQNVYGVRPAPVKVEAFHELVSGDNEHNKLLTSPK